MVTFENGYSEQRGLTKEVTGHRDANAMPTNLRSDSNASLLGLLTPLARDNLQREIRASSDWLVTRVTSDTFRVSLTEAAIRSKNGVPKHAHLFNWSPVDEETTIIIRQDSNGVPRLHCGLSCFTCKKNYPCSRVIAIKGGRVDKGDVHFRYYCDYVIGLFPFLKREVNDLTAFQGAIFTLADDERNIIAAADTITGSDLVLFLYILSFAVVFYLLTTESESDQSVIFLLLFINITSTYMNIYRGFYTSKWSLQVITTICRSSIMILK